MEKRGATVNPIIAEIIDAPKMKTHPYNKLSIVSLHDLYLLASSIVDAQVLMRKTSEYISIAPAIKPETKNSWIREMHIE